MAPLFGVRGFGFGFGLGGCRFRGGRRHRRGALNAHLERRFHLGVQVQFDLVFARAA